MHIIRNPSAVARGAVSRMGIARRATVYQFLESSYVGHRGRFDDEANGHEGDGWEWDVIATEDTVDAMLYYG